MIRATNSKIHWNYFIALEQDLETMSRYVEFNHNNFEVYSIELMQLLFAASSEVDVVAKLVCKLLKPRRNPNNINHYKEIISSELPELAETEVIIPRYGLTLQPWDSWTNPDGGNPYWWKSYNNVKHQRDRYFSEATLKNALNAMGGLLILTFHYYNLVLSDSGNRLSKKDTTRQLDPNSTLIFLPSDYYFDNLIV